MSKDNKANKVKVFKTKKENENMKSDFYFIFYIP